MPKRRTILLLLAAVAMFAGVLQFGIRSREPSYKGRPLSEWLRTYPRTKQSLAVMGGRGYSDSEQKALVATRQIGTNAVPFLVTWIQDEPPPIVISLENLLRKAGMPSNRTARRMSRAYEARLVLADLACRHDLSHSPYLRQLARLRNPGSNTAWRIFELKCELWENRPEYRSLPWDGAPPKVVSANGRVISRTVTNAPAWSQVETEKRTPRSSYFSDPALRALATNNLLQPPDLLIDTPPPKSP